MQAEAFFILLWKWMLAYALFAFLITLVREIQKDMEDVEGDKSGQYRTLPIVWGVSAARKISSCILLLTIIALIWLELYILEGQATWMHGLFVLCLTLPLIVSLYYSAFGRGRKSFSRASFFTKMAFVGILPVSLLFMYLIGI
jgi:4-hydroxybenzoate polyprenyltransferase